MAETREMLLQQMSLLLDKAKERKDDSGDLTKLSFGMSNIARAITNCDEKKELLNALKSIDGALKRIEQSLMAEKQYEVTKEAVSHAMLGEKYNSAPKDDGEYIKGAVQSATHDTFQ